MPSLKAIRKRIASTKNTQKITKAMKMVAAAKLRRAQDAVQTLRPYAQRLGQIAGEVAERLLNEPQPDAIVDGGAAPETAQEKPHDGGGEAGEQTTAERAQLIARILLGESEQRIRLIVVSADRGLAGAYNSSLFRRVERFMVDEAGKQIDLIVLGKKAREYFRKRPFKVVKELAGVDPKTAAERAKELEALLTESLLQGETDAIYIVYNEFKSVASQAVRLDRLLPVRVAQKAAVDDDEPRSLLDFEYEPNREEVLAQLLPLYLDAELQRILLEAVASFFAAQMRAMESASRNAKEMIARLTLQYNRARQAAITKELMEIIGGAEALKG